MAVKKARVTDRYVYTRKFEIYSRGRRKTGMEVKSDYLDMKDPERIAFFVKMGYIRKV